MRLATFVLAVSFGLAALPAQTQEMDWGAIFEGLGRALTPEEERERAERRQRFEGYGRLYEEEQDRGADYSYGERTNRPRMRGGGPP